MEERFYVTVIRGPKKVGWLAGPFMDKTAADITVRRARDKAIELDPWCVFDAFGVARVSLPIDHIFPTGVLNAYLEIIP